VKSVIVGSAGHIDHGKSALVRALTGTDPDRLEEEKRRGITIDIGFAHLELPIPPFAKTGREGGPPVGETLRLGFVDVPGHERFVRNMLAGAGGIDVVLLVIAADESIKPQTCEHFDIVRLLDIPRGLVALTKSDLVDKETLDVVRMEIEEFLRGSFMEGATVVPVSSKTGAGLDELKRELAKVATEVRAKDSTAVPRLPIDRVFSMKGFGTVVTGTLVSGTIRKDDELVLFPGDRRLRVRGVQVHGTSAEQASAGERTALNLAGVETGELARGMTLSIGAFRVASRIDVALSLLPDAKPLKDRAKVHLHFYTTETIAEVVLIRAKNTRSLDSGGQPRPASARDDSSKVMQPGENAFAQLRLREPWLALPGDRFIIRQFSPVVTIGGGIALEANPSNKLSKLPNYAEYLRTLQRATPEGAFRTRVIVRGTNGFTVADAVAATGRRELELMQMLPLAGTDPITGLPLIIRIGDTFITGVAFDVVKKGILAAVTAFHNQNRLANGMSLQELRSHHQDVAPEVLSAAIQQLVSERKLAIQDEVASIPGRGIAMKDEEAASHRQIEQAFASAGLKVPALKEVLAGLKVDRTRAQKIVTLLLRDKVLVKLSDDLVFHRDALESLRKAIAAQKTKSPKIDVAKFKDLTGVSRKYAIPLLEWLDRERVTRRVGDERIIL
jgi:selenocysteine-specific elongation factor